MSTRTRMVGGIGMIGGGVVVAFVGWLGISAETEVAFQLPYLASAGVGALMLLGAGATALITAQIQADTGRLDEVEEAVRLLAAEIERLADVVARSRPSGESRGRASSGGRASPVVVQAHGANGGERSSRRPASS